MAYSVRLHDTRLVQILDGLHYTDCTADDFIAAAWQL